MTLSQARKEAIQETKDDKYIVKHINYNAKRKSYSTSDWYDSDATVASYKNGELTNI